MCLPMKKKEKHFPWSAWRCEASDTAVLDLNDPAALELRLRQLRNPGSVASQIMFDKL